MRNSNHIFTVGALGDSISVGFNAESSGENKSYSWVTGDQGVLKASSHVQRLKQVFPALIIEAQNLAQNGARATDLRPQVDRLLPFRPDYVSLLIGANDVTRWLFGEYRSLLDLFLGDVRNAIGRLVASNPRILILLVSVPDQSQVVSFLAKKHLGENSSLTQFGSGAYLPQFLTWIKERSQALNEGLGKLAKDFSGNVRFVSSIASTRFSGEHLSPLDSYHPSTAGQRLLADLTWREGFFP